MAFLPSFLALLAFLAVGSALREAKEGEFPFQVSVQGLDRRHLCGGAIITPKWVLTTKSCLQGQGIVTVAYGSVDSNTPVATVNSQRIVPELNVDLEKKNSLALIELETAIEFSKTVKAAGLPTKNAEIRNTTKLSGWNVSPKHNLPSNLFVSDVYHIVATDCRTPTGIPVHLSKDEFCGMEEEEEEPSQRLVNPGSTVSKRAIVLGILERPPQAAHYPNVYVMVSHHEDWIRGVLKTDAQHVNWVDNVPKDSAPSSTVSLALVALSAIFIRFV